MENFFTFVLISILLVILPGPDIVVLTKNTLKEGTAGGMKTMSGICSALLIHTCIAVAGLSAIIASSAYLFSLFKIIGATYLIYLGITAFLSMKKEKVNMNDLHKVSKKKNGNSFQEGFFTDLLNPKVAALFLTLLPQFVEPSAGHLIPFLLLGLTYTGLTFLYSLIFILLINQINEFMQKQSTQKVIQGISGALLVGFGLKLAFERNPI